MKKSILPLCPTVSGEIVKTQFQFQTGDCLAFQCFPALCLLQQNAFFLLKITSFWKTKMTAYYEYI